MPQAGMQPTPRAMGPNEAEWRGLEVRPAATGVVVTNADGTAARMGLQPGDRVASVNGVQIRTMADFVGATQNGDLPQGTIIVGRDGQRLAFELSRAPANQAPPNGAMGG
jgi:S1-C subfamily serine protease